MTDCVVDVMRAQMRLGVIRAVRLALGADELEALEAAASEDLRRAVRRCVRQYARLEVHKRDA